MSKSRTYRDLPTVLQLVNPENRLVVKTMAEVLGLVEFTLTTSYIRAKRLDRGPDIRIGPGWSNGYVSRAEAFAAAGGIVSESDVWESDGRPGLFGTTLPAHGRAHHGVRKADREPAKVCPGCNVTLPATGICDTCS